VAEFRVLEAVDCRLEKPGCSYVHKKLFSQHRMVVVVVMAAVAVVMVVAVVVMNTVCHRWSRG
jgi:hypothetical protein